MNYPTLKELWHRMVIDENGVEKTKKMKNKISQKTNRKNLLQLLWLRLVAIFGQALAILITHHFLEITLPLTPMFLVLLFMVFVTAFGFYRYRSQNNQDLRISDKSLFFELLFDVAALTAQLYFSGGISNPFISLFLLQVIIATILLRKIYACSIALITIICYIWLSFYHQHLHAFHHQMEAGDFFNLHLQGMLISYVFAAILLLIFMTKIIANLNEREEKISLLKRQALEKEQIIRMGLLATGAAHNLGTPLSTISVIVNDWKNIDLTKEDLMKDVAVIETQLNRCKKIISEILFVSGKVRLEEAKLVKIKEAFDSLVDDWKKSRKAKNVVYEFFGEAEQKIFFDNLLAQAFGNIFDNALEASPDFIFIKVKAEEKEVRVIVEDRGKGFSDKVLQEIGKPNLTTKNSSGVGLFLAINSLHRIGGNLKVSNIPAHVKDAEPRPRNKCGVTDLDAIQKHCHPAFIAGSSKNSKFGILNWVEHIAVIGARVEIIIPLKNLPVCPIDIRDGVPRNAGRGSCRVSVSRRDKG